MGTWMCFWILCFCILALRIHSFIMTQSPKLTFVSVGDSVGLKCTAEVKVQYCYNSITWQKLNIRTGELKLVKTSYDNSVLHSDGRTCVLTLKNLTIKDSGLYYCISQSSSMAMIGSGSRVIVTGSSKPKLSILYSPQEDESPSVALQCLVSGVVPSQVQVFWMIGEEKRVGRTESAWTNNNDSATEFTRAHLSVPAEEWTDAREIQCVVQYNGEDFSKTLKSCDLGDPGYNPRTFWLLYCGCGSVFLITVAVFSVYLWQGKKSTSHEEISSVMFYPVDLISLGQKLNPTKK